MKVLHGLSELGSIKRFRRVDLGVCPFSWPTWFVDRLVRSGIYRYTGRVVVYGLVEGRWEVVRSGSGGYVSTIEFRELLIGKRSRCNVMRSRWEGYLRKVSAWFPESSVYYDYVAVILQNRMLVSYQGDSTLITPLSDSTVIEDGGVLPDSSWLVRDTREALRYLFPNSSL